MSLSEKLALIIEANPASAVKGLTAIGTSAEKELTKAEGHAASFGKTMAHVGVGMLATGAVITGALVKASQAAGQAEVAQLKLENSVENSSKVAKGSAPQWEALAKSIQNKTAASRLDIMAGEAQLIQMGADANQVKTLTPLIVDLARKKGVDLVTANTAVGKAINGTETALKRMGVVVDKTAFGIDHTAAVTQALRSSVGGFAEQEGKTFEGSLARLKNQLHDIEIGVGKGAVDAFTNLLGPVAKVSDAFSNLSPGTQSAVGEIAAYGAAGLIAVGTTAALAGKLVAAKTNFSNLATEMPKVAGALKTVGVAAGVAGAAFVVFEAVKFAQSFAEHRVDVDRFSAALTGADSAMKKQATDQLLLLNSTGKLGDAIGRAADQNVVGANRMIDAAQAAGVSSGEIDKLRKITADKAAADAAGAKDQDALTQATKEATAAYTAQRDALTAEFDPLFAATKAQKNLATAQQAVADAVKQYGPNSKEATDANQAAVEAALGLNSALLSLKQGFEDNAVTLDDAKAKLQQWVAEGRITQTQADQAAGSFQALKAQIDQIPTAVQTTVTANTDDATAKLAALDKELHKFAGVTVSGSVPVGTSTGHPATKGSPWSGARAAGGPVEAGKAYLVGENGPEPFIPGTNGYILPNSSLSSLKPAGSRMSTAPAGAPVINVHIHADATADGHKLAAVVVPAIQKHVGTLYGGNVQAALGGRR